MWLSSTSLWLKAESSLLEFHVTHLDVEGREGDRVEKNLGVCVTYTDL